MVIFRYIILVCVIALLAACSQGAAKDIEDLFEEGKIESFSINIDNVSTGSIKEQEKISDLYQILDNVKFESVSSEEAIEILKSKHAESIQVMLETETQFNGYHIELLEDGRLTVIDVNEGIGEDFYKSVGSSSELYDEIFTFSKEKLDHGKPVQQNILEQLEEDDKDKVIEYPDDDRITDNGE
ncbi:hypothetical protein [Bacillus sp. Marseille-Q3570]|uniref:hypothetical protein n=1 Tax=Bacillus sp. Marseille-Q3570 TaxID=2963522 RepID=UPI0021B72ED5|nr:hypothetical protein [Bacillus sp. Marseille-Q3570]